MKVHNPFSKFTSIKHNSHIFLCSLFSYLLEYVLLYNIFVHQSPKLYLFSTPFLQSLYQLLLLQRYPASDNHTSISIEVLNIVNDIVDERTFVIGHNIGNRFVCPNSGSNILF